MLMTRGVARTCIGARTFARVLVAPGSDEALSGLRHEVAAWLGSHQRRDDAITVLVELLENALAHGSRPGGVVTLLVTRLAGGRLSVCVRDAGRTESDAPFITTPGFGHGTRIVEDRSERVATTIRRDGGWEVRAVLAAVPPPVIEPDVDLEALLAAYPDGEPAPDRTPDGGDGAA